jgi:hypothetical protein
MTNLDSLFGKLFAGLAKMVVEFFANFLRIEFCGNLINVCQIDPCEISSYCPK